MKELQDLSNLITVRTFLVSSIDNLNIKLSRENIKEIQTRIQLIDKTIVEHSLKLDLAKLNRDTTDKLMVREISVESSEDTEAVMKKFNVVHSTPDEKAFSLEQSPVNLSMENSEKKKK